VGAARAAGASEQDIAEAAWLGAGAAAAAAGKTIAEVGKAATDGARAAGGSRDVIARISNPATGLAAGRGVAKVAAKAAGAAAAAMALDAGGSASDAAKVAGVTAAGVAIAAGFSAVEVGKVAAGAARAAGGAAADVAEAAGLAADLARTINSKEPKQTPETKPREPAEGGAVGKDEQTEEASDGTIGAQIGSVKLNIDLFLAGARDRILIGSDRRWLWFPVLLVAVATALLIFWLIDKWDFAGEETSILGDAPHENVANCVDGVGGAFGDASASVGAPVEVATGELGAAPQHILKEPVVSEDPSADGTPLGLYKKPGRLSGPSCLKICCTYHACFSLTCCGCCWRFPRSCVCVPPSQQDGQVPT
jgi:hypothetical protein